MLNKEQVEKLEKQQYRVVGNHSVCKICHWTKECVREKNRVCYKQHFYDVHCGKCLEMSPVILCNQRCLHCWRDTSLFGKEWKGSVDEPKEIIQGCIAARKKLLMGFKGHDDVDLKKFEDYIVPDHAAISLTGEPCLYPRLPELVDSFFNDFDFRTVFLVTNGTVPGMLKKFGKESRHFPTNIYLSLEGYDLKSHKKLNNPVSAELWDKVKESMKYLFTVKNKTRTILRITAIKGYNLDKALRFVKFVKLMQPTHIEVKGYAFLGYSRKRLKEENIPSWEEVRKFAQELGQECGYIISGEQEASFVVQLSS